LGFSLTFMEISGNCVFYYKTPKKRKKIQLLLFVIAPLSCFCQNIGSNNLSTNPAKNSRTQTAGFPFLFTLSGNVVLRYDETKIKCDSAVVDNKNSMIYAYGNVMVAAGEDLQLSSPFVALNIANKKAIGVCMLHYDKMTQENLPVEITW
jgi:OstA-like protein